jgi:hypothetical protein
MERNTLTERGTRVPLLHEQVLRLQGAFRLVRRWWRGWHPELGQLHRGWRGRETVAEVSAVRASHFFEVRL